MSGQFGAGEGRLAYPHEVLQNPVTPNKTRGAVMSDWDFLYEMNDRGYSPEEIADAAASGAAPWEWAQLDRKWIDASLDGEHSGQGQDDFLHGSQEQVDVFLGLVDCAVRYHMDTGRYLQIWGELGELYAEIKWGLERHEAHRAGSDGAISGRLIEVKTISPEKSSDRVSVKSQGDFEQLLIVRIDSDFRFSAKLFERSELQGQNGKLLRGRFQLDGPGPA
ncbi:hypothetical protein [Hydrogenophaga sp. PBL-H3]|uniref:hypothetical protein n=1 Tax=Hydrogenophaga sp. PBL-H3 TaxID=434010 RepID=UPI001F1B9FBC|nr:hypothetical protein [Hydrogenophaga sp. PBL-H3]